MSRLSYLPPEVVENILSNLTKYHLASCLMVSRTYHAIAQRLIFKSISLIFMEGSKSKSSREGGRHLTEQTWEILERITSDVHFASLVRDIKVFSLGSSLHVFEHRNLVKALRAVHRIESFSWFCEDIGMSCPDEHVPEQVAACVSALPKNLLGLSVPVPGLNAGLTIDSHFDCLQRLCLSSQRYHVGDHRGTQLLVKRQIEACYCSLQDLTTSGAQLVHIVPASMFGRLTKLTLHHLRKHNKSSGLVPGLLRHNAHLDTLDLQGELNGIEFPSLGYDRSILPRLKRLRLISHDDEALGIEFFLSLSQFICDREASLKSLDVYFTIEEDFVDIAFFLCPLSLSTFHVLGIGLEPTFHNQNRTKTLIESLPRNDMKALRLCIGGRSVMDADMTGKLLKCISDRSSLEFLHLCTTMGCSVPCTAEDILGCNLPHLETLLLNDVVWRLRPLPDGSKSLHRLPTWRYNTRFNEDLYNGDIAWLNTTQTLDFFDSDGEDSDPESDLED